jgi:hypothetical protein
VLVDPGAPAELDDVDGRRAPEFLPGGEPRANLAGRVAAALLHAHKPPVGGEVAVAKEGGGELFESC